MNNLQEKRPDVKIARIAAAFVIITLSLMTNGAQNNRWRLRLYSYRSYSIFDYILKYPVELNLGNL